MKSKLIISRFFLCLVIAGIGACKKKDDVNTVSISGFFPNSGLPEDTITINGAGFPADTDEIIVKLGEQNSDLGTLGIELPIIEASSSQLKVVIPKTLNSNGITNGPIVISVGGTEVKSRESFFAGRIILNKDIIEPNVVWRAQTNGRKNKYLLIGTVRVRAGGILTIEPGTLIFGDKNSQGTLVVERGGTLKAEGTRDNPIVFTSNQPKGRRSAGDWGGIIMLGTAPVQGDNVRVEGLREEIRYGGNDPTNNSGTIKFVRIEYAGIPLSPGNEINGLTLGGVGENTTIEYVQVSYCGDDSFEWFGGTVNSKFLISLGAVDDDFDTDLSYAGFVQYGLALRDPFISDISQSNGIESDNSSNGEGNTRAFFSNITYIGAENLVRNLSLQAGLPQGTLHGRGAHLRRRTAQSIFNSVFVGTNLAGISMDGVNLTNAQETPIKFLNDAGSFSDIRYNVIIAPADSLYPFRAGAFGVESQVNGSSNFTIVPEAAQVPGRVFEKLKKINEIQIGNTGLSNKERVDNLLILYGLIDLCDFKRITNPALLPGPNSPLIKNKAAKFDGKGAAANANVLDKTITFQGAFGSQNWAEGWSNFDPQNTDY